MESFPQRIDIRGLELRVDDAFVYPPETAAILVISCDSYQDLWPPFFKCFFKYWPDCPYPVYLGSNRCRYPDDRVRPILVGDDKDYSSNLLEMLKHLKEDWVLLWIEDRVLCAPVESARICTFVRLAQRVGAGYLKLIPIHPFALTSNVGHEIGDLERGCKYRVSITVALWNKETLVKLLRPGESAWEIERNGSGRSNALSERFLSLSKLARDNPPITERHLIIRGRLLREARRFVETEELQPYLSRRLIQSMPSHVYTRAYRGYSEWLHFVRRVSARFDGGTIPVF
jgi:hypothetical protein